MADRQTLDRNLSTALQESNAEHEQLRVHDSRATSVGTLQPPLVDVCNARAQLHIETDYRLE